MKLILAQALERVKPTKKQRSDATRTIKTFVKTLNDTLKNHTVDATAVVGGSFAKDTWIAGEFDVDIFVKFDTAHKDENLSDLLERALPKPHERIHGSRDYFQLAHAQINFEVIPVLDIKKAQDAQNVTDFSPLHVAWVKKNINGKNDDILLAKQFCKAHGLYGAESYINGLSGHVLDILIIHYGGFLPFLKAASKWKDKTIIDPSNKYKGKALYFLNTSKTTGPLVVVDPVQPERNAAAAVALDKFTKLIADAKKFLKKATPDAFIVKNADQTHLLTKGYHIVHAELANGSADVAGTKMLKAFDFVRDYLADYTVQDCGWEWHKKGPALWWFKTKLNHLDPTVERRGPPIKFADAASDFKKTHKKTFVRGDHVWTITPRDHTNPAHAIELALTDSYVTERIKNARLHKN